MSTFTSDFANCVIINIPRVDEESCSWGTFLVYVIEIRSSISEDFMLINRRYSEFLNLHETLKKRYQDAEIQDFRFPPKILVASTKEKIEERRRAFQDYLRALLRLPTIAPEVIYFLRLTNFKPDKGDVKVSGNQSAQIENTLPITANVSISAIGSFHENTASTSNVQDLHETKEETNQTTEVPHNVISASSKSMFPSFLWGGVSRPNLETRSRQIADHVSPPPTPTPSEFMQNAKSIHHIALRATITTCTVSSLIYIIHSITQVVARGKFSIGK